VLALAVSACEPTKGSNPDAFQEQPTTNGDFLTPQFIPVGLQPTSAAVAPTTTPIVPPNIAGNFPCTSTNPNLRPVSAVANFEDSTVSILNYDPSSNTLFVQSTQPTGFAPTRLVFGDLDHSNSTAGACTFDIVAMLAENTVSDGDGVTILQTTDNVNWSRQDISFLTTPAEIALEDMDDDGWVDLVVSMPADFAIWIFRNLGAAGGPGNRFNPTPDVVVPLTGSPGRFVVQQGFAGANLNLDGDNCTDIIALVPGLNVINTLSSNNGAVCAPFSGGSYALASFGVDVNPVDLAAADLNSDGITDLMVLTAGDAPPRVDFLAGPTFGPFANTPIEIRGSPVRMAAQIYDGADIGVVTADSLDQSASVVNTGGNATAFSYTYYTAKGNPFDLAPGHFSGAFGLPDTTHYDIAISDSIKRVLYIGHNDGAGNFSFTQVAFANAPGGPDLGFISGTQSYPDVLLTQRLNSTLVFLPSRCNTASPSPPCS
jgi:hypothetical protein